MRLTCPNCSAKYEVDESMIPAEGRDVQCSNCSTTWFQPGVRVSDPAPVATPGLEPDLSDSDPVAPEEEQFSEVEQAGDTSEPESEPEAEIAEAEEDATAVPEASQIDAGVASILREEAERESRLRHGNAVPGPVETQAEMPLDSDADRARTRVQSEFDEAEDAFEVEDLAVSAAGAMSSRGELLPDIEEINSTLRATEDRSSAEADASDVDTVVGTSRRRSRFRFGFFLMLFLAVLAALIYIYAPQIAEALPPAGPILERYVDAVNSARFWLDDIARSAAGDATGAGE